jgi:hypothetical protein
VKVRAVLDKGIRMATHSAVPFLLNAKVPVFIDEEHEIAHNKLILVDGATAVLPRRLVRSPLYQTRTIPM